MRHDAQRDTSYTEVTRDLLLEYDRAGPRYTSYPTAPEWRDDFSSEDYERALARAAAEPGRPLSVYVHVPFCRKRCAYCGCNTTVLGGREELDGYLRALQVEMERVRDALGERGTVKQLHWGGGTPTTLGPDDISFLHEALRQRFDIAPDAELALEVDPRVTTQEQVRLLADLGFNRISMGVQDLDPGVQAAIGRHQTEEQTRRVFDWCREAGFKGINMDLVYGLPGQRPGTWTGTIRKVIEIGPDRLAVYSFAYLPERLKNQEAIDPATLPTGPEKYELFARARRLFVEAGYRPIGMDHFARPDDELAVALDERRLKRNFMGYTTMLAEDMVGFGVSAIGKIGGCYAQNEKTLSGYYGQRQRVRFATARGCVLSEDDRIRGWVIGQLMCVFYLDTQEFERRFGVTYADYFAAEEGTLQEFYEQGFLACEDGNLRVLPLGQVFVRNLAMVFDAYLRKPGSRQEFSRTV